MPTVHTVRSLRIALAGGDTLADLFADRPLLLLLPRTERRVPTGRVSRYGDTERDKTGTSKGPTGAFALLSNAETQVIPVQKSDRNPFSALFTIGRSSTNDLVIKLDSVSKVHCFLSETKGEWFAQDNGSSNGIVIESESIKHREKVPISPGTSLWVGRQELVFMDQASLLALLEIVSKRQATE